MNTIERLNMAIEYIEQHLDEKIDIEEMVRFSQCSLSDIQKTFSLIVEIPISEYIRKRRMTLAAKDLKTNGIRVIDAAMKYGYDSSVSFTRAFHAFHGVTPSAVKKSNCSFNEFPRLMFKITVSEVKEMYATEKITIGGKIYEAEYLGEADMSSWSNRYKKRNFWRLKNAYDDFKHLPPTGMRLSYNNYPPIEIENGQVFVIDHFLKKDGTAERGYFISNGTTYKDIPYTIEVLLEPTVLRTDCISVLGKEYEAEYFGPQDMSSWTDKYSYREFRRLKNAYSDFEELPKSGHVLPYNNYPKMDMDIGQVFVIDYHLKENDEIERRYYISNGVVWQNMTSTAQVLIMQEPIRIDRLNVNGKEYDAEYFGVSDMSHWSDVYSHREFWRVLNAYEDFSKLSLTGHVLPYNNYPPINISLGQAFVVDYYPKSKAAIERKLYIANGIIYKDRESTSEVTADE